MRYFFILLIFIFYLASSNISYAYIDPGSGSAIISAIVGFIVAIGISIKTYWYKIKSLFVKKEVDINKEPSNNEK